MMAWIVVALLAVFSADAGVTSSSNDVDTDHGSVQTLDDGSLPPPPKP